MRCKDRVSKSVIISAVLGALFGVRRPVGALAERSGNCVFHLNLLVLKAAGQSGDRSPHTKSRLNSRAVVWLAGPCTRTSGPSKGSARRGSTVGGGKG